jgi:hypothetical protein
MTIALLLTIAIATLWMVPLEHTGYITGAPVPDWLGLATLDGRDAIQLGDNCDGVVPGVNVVLLDDGDLQLVNPPNGDTSEPCEVVTHLHMSDVPCARDPTGACDVAFS